MSSSSTSTRRNFAEVFAGSSVQRATSAIARKATSVLTPEQLECVERLETCVDRVLACKRRDMYLGQLAHCITSFSDADKDEPLTADSFSVYDCYRVYTQELIYFPEKFDFLIYCVMYRVCTVHKPRQFNELLDDILMPPTVALAQRIGGELLQKLIEEDEQREDDEVARVESFCLRKDWHSNKSRSSVLGSLYVVGGDNSAVTASSSSYANVAGNRKQ